MFKILYRFFDFCGAENKRRFYRSLVCGVFQAFFEALKIPAIAVMLDAVIRGEVTGRAIGLSFGIMVLSVAGAGAARYRSTILQTEAGYGACANKRIEIAEHLRYLPMGYFNKNSLGAITSVTTNTMESVSDVATRVVMMVSQGLLNTLLITAMVLAFDWRVGLVAAAGLALYFWVNSLLQSAARRISPRKIEADTALVEQVLEYVQGIAEVKNYGLTGAASQKLNRAIDENVDANTLCELRFVPLMGLQSLILKLTGVAMTALAVWLWAQDRMGLMPCIVLVICAFILYASLESAGNYSALLRTIDLGMDKAQAILDQEPMDTDGQDLHPAHFDLDAEAITFSYGKRRIIDGITVHIPEKTTTAIVGPSGGGKTTFCSLLSRFWDVQSGCVRLGGVDVRDYSMDSLMRNFSFVFQNVYLFQDTVANIIRFGQPDAPMEQVVAAAKKACCHDFIMALPDGYDTVIGEGRANLSGGEKQRISIARAIMKDAPIIVLDEATANVDPENEKSLVEAIEALTREKTILMIAHRLKTVQNADQILVIDRGRIVQQGRHDALMQEDGLYRRFVQARAAAASWRL